MDSRPLHNVFISYSHEDRFIAATLAQRLREMGYRPWIDYSGIIGGEAWASQIQQAISQTEVLLVLLTPDSAASEWVRREVELAQTGNHPVIPLLVRPADLPGYLQHIQVIDCVQDSEDAFKDLQRALVTAFKRVSATLPAQHPAPPPPTLQTPIPQQVHPAAAYVIPPPITRSKPIFPEGSRTTVERIVFSQFDYTTAFQYAAYYLKLAGFEMTHDYPVWRFARGSDLLVYVVGGGKAAKATVTLEAVPAYGGQLTAIRVTYAVSAPSGVRIGRADSRFFECEMSELENAIITGTVDRRESKQATFATLTSGFVLYFFVYGGLLIGINLLSSGGVHTLLIILFWIMVAYHAWIVYTKGR
jgi:hypothetical protein